MSATGTTPLLRGTLVGGLAVTWSVLAHRASIGGASDLAAAFAMLPIAIVAVLLLRRIASPFWTPVAAFAALALMALIWPKLRENVALLYYLQHVGINLALAFVFGRTLGSGAKPLVTQLAHFAHPEGMSPARRRYTRQVTVAWTIFFLGVAAVSTGLFWLAPAAVWSVFANFLMLPLILAMFAGEHLCRNLVLPPADRGSIADTFRAFRAGRQRKASPTDLQ